MDPTLRDLADTLSDGLHRRVTAEGRRIVVKRRRHAPGDFFAMEAFGLAKLREPGCWRVPETIAVQPDVIVLEDLGDGQASPHDWRRAGTALARQHACTANSFGLDRDGWCGDGRQRNTPMVDGWRFFADCRLLPLTRLARDSELLTSNEVITIERLCTALPERVPWQPASLLHGDLWLGNLHPCRSGELAPIDAAAVHYGWAEAELAMLTLFGEPPPVFFDGYRQNRAPAPDWRQRAPLYNLHHLLNHLNVFGASWHGRVAATLRRLR